MTETEKRLLDPEPKPDDRLDQSLRLIQEPHQTGILSEHHVFHPWGRHYRHRLDDEA